MELLGFLGRLEASLFEVFKGLLDIFLGSWVFAEDVPGFVEVSFGVVVVAGDVGGFAGAFFSDESDRDFLQGEDFF